MNTKAIAAIAAVPILAASALIQAPAGAADVDYSATTACAYSQTDPGWASVGRAPRGTTSVVFTMRTGTPSGWNSVDVASDVKARKWRTATPAGSSFINWVTFYNGQTLLGSAMVNLRCEGTPAEWPV